jgi:acyl carrier protein
MSIDLTSGIKTLIAEHFGIDQTKLTAETQIASLGIDSLSMIEFMFQMEERFKVHLADSRAPLVTVADVVGEIERAVGAQRLSQAA